MGMTTTQLLLIRAIAENKLADAKKYALACCAEDTTRKNEYAVKRYRSMLENNPTTMEIPFNIKGMAQMQDISTVFREDRYFVSESEQKLFEQIVNMNKASVKLMELGIPYLNATLLTGPPGTGKTTFAKYIAYKLELPFLYINFSHLIEAHMGKTAQNLRNVFDYAKMNKCLFVLDEIDCIAQKRTGASEGSTKELNNTTISFIQALDQIQNDSIIIGATNIPHVIDPAIIRRFSIQHEIKPPTREEAACMIQQYMKTIGYQYEGVQEAVQYIYHNKTKPTQSDVLKYILSKIVTTITNDGDKVQLSP